MKAFGTDYDGVIINIEPQKAAAFAKVLNKNWGINTDNLSRFWMETGGTSRRYKFDHFYREKFGKGISENEYKVIEKEFSDILRNEFYPKVKLLPGALELLKYVQENFDFTFVSSGVPVDEIKYLVNLNGVSQYFNLVLGTNDLYPSKREHFNKINEEQKPDSIIFIADSAEDMKVAKEFGATTIGVFTNSPEEKLKEAGANYTCSDLFEALNILKSH